MSDLTPDVQAALDNLRTVNWDHLGAGELADAEQLVVERIQSAYRSALAGETPKETMQEAYCAAGPAMMEKHCKCGTFGGVFLVCHHHSLMLSSALDLAAPILRAPLLLQLQDKNERIKALEAQLRVSP